MTTMTGTLVGIGALALIGIGGYYGSGSASMTALIPVVFAVLLLLLASAAHEVSWRQPWLLWTAAAVAAIGALGTLRALPELAELLSGGAVESTIATVGQGLMLLTMLGLLTLYARALAALRGERRVRRATPRQVAQG